MLAEAAGGRLPREAARAVLEAAGHRKHTSRSVYPAGLSQREAEVLALLARGASTKEIGARLDISPKTADHHVQSVYDKTGARGRAAAAVFALAHGILAGD
jgi:DNA-binding CsgD family transcriptional regulator